MRSRWLVFAATVNLCLPRLSSAGSPAHLLRRDHPDPRVIVDVLNVTGPHKRADVEREARKALWGKIIGCYLPAAAKIPGLRGETTLTFRVGAGGDVGAVRAGSSTLGDAELVACFEQLVGGLSLPKAPSASEASMQIHVAPGDPPGATRPH